MTAQPCETCRWPALFLEGGACLPCRVRAGETIPGHRLVGTPQTGAPQTGVPATLIVCARDGSQGCEALQLKLN